MDSGNMRSRSSEVAAKKELRQRFRFAADGLHSSLLRGTTFFVNLLRNKIFLQPTIVNVFVFVLLFPAQALHLLCRRTTSLKCTIRNERFDTTQKPDLGFEKGRAGGLPQLLHLALRTPRSQAEAD